MITAVISFKKLVVVLACLIAADALAESSTTRPTIHVNGIDLPIPTEPQAKWQDLELGMFIHFDIEVFDKDYQITHERGFARKPMGAIEPAEFNPEHLDTDQWLDVATRLGAKYACFTCKHSSGFLMWQSDLYPYGVKQSPWKNGKGDVVQEYLASCRKAGVEPGLYCSAGGNSWWQLNRGRYTYRRGEITGDPKDIEAFLDMDRKLYEDLWSKTGPAVYMWFDGGINPFGDTLQPLIKKYLPNTVCFNGPEMGAPGGLARWSGNEKGFVGYPLWNTIDITNDQHDRHHQ
jgi:alpha-L-fucosidase